MEAIVCQSCDKVIAYVESEKSGTLYGTCPGCRKDKSEQVEKAESVA